MATGQTSGAPLPAQPPSDQAGLSPGALGTSGLVVLGVAYMGLALAAYLVFGIMERYAGPVVPLAFIAVTILMLPTAASYAVMNARRPSTGSTLTWLWEATLPSLGIWLGWILVITYTVGAALQPVMFGLFFDSLLDVFHVHVGAVAAVASGAAAVLVAGLLTRRAVRVSARAIGVFVFVEAGFVALLSLYIVIRQGLAGHLSFAPLEPSHAASWSGFLEALLFGVLSIAAFDIIAPLAEETRTPRSIVPRATIVVTLGAGAYWVVTSFGIVNSVPAVTMNSYVDSGQFTPVYLIAQQYIGPLKVMVPLTGFTASAAALSAVSIAASRQLFALAREHMAPAAFAVANKFGTPWNAQRVVLGCCLVVPGLVTLYQKANLMLAFNWLGSVYVFLILIPYTLTCAGNILYHFRYRPGSINWFTNLALPVAGIVINCYILYKNFLATFVFHPASFRADTSITVACVGLVVLAVFAAVAGVWRNGGVSAPPHQLDEAAGQDL